MRRSGREVRRGEHGRRHREGGPRDRECRSADARFFQTARRVLTRSLRVDQIHQFRARFFPFFHPGFNRVDRLSDEIDPSNKEIDRPDRWPTDEKSAKFPRMPCTTEARVTPRPTPFRSRARWSRATVWSACRSSAGSPPATAPRGRRHPRAAAGFVAGLVALAAVVALATGADAPARALASLGKASGASKGRARRASRASARRPRTPRSTPSTCSRGRRSARGGTPSTRSTPRTTTCSRRKQHPRSSCTPSGSARRCAPTRAAWKHQRTRTCWS